MGYFPGAQPSGSQHRTLAGECVGRGTTKHGAARGTGALVEPARHKVCFQNDMQTTCGSVVIDGDEQLVMMPENKTAEFYKYLRGYGFSFTIDCRGFCEDNIFCFPESENTEKLKLIVSRFGLNHA